MTREELLERLNRRKALFESLKTRLPTGDEFLELADHYGVYKCIEQMCPHTFDTALPQGWVNHTIKNHNWNPTNTKTKIVWTYKKGEPFGTPFPCTKEAKQLLEQSYPNLT